jgi:hypothetical protein
MNTSYPTNLNDSQWSAILNVLNDKRKRKHSLREIFNAMPWINRFSIRKDNPQRRGMSRN